jgi:hypothetical protein
MTDNPRIDRTVRWIGIIGLYGGLVLAVAGATLALAGVLAGAAPVGATGGVSLIVGVAVATGGGYLAHYWGTPWDNGDESNNLLTEVSAAGTTSIEEAPANYKNLPPGFTHEGHTSRAQGVQEELDWEDWESPPLFEE